MDPAPQPTPTPARRGRRWVRRLVSAVWTLIALAAVLLVAGYVALDWTVKRVLTQLTGSALPGGLSYRVLRVTPWELTVGDIAVPGPDAPRLSLLTARFDPRRIAYGEVDELLLSGLRLTVETSANGAAVTGLPVAAGGGGDWFTAVPPRIELRDALVKLEYDALTAELPVAGNLRRNGNTLLVTLDAGVAGRTLTGTAQVRQDPGGALAITSEGVARWAVSELVPLLPADWRPGISATGVAELVWRGSTDTGTWLGELRTSDLHVALFGLGQAKIPAVEARARWDGQVVEAEVALRGDVSLPGYLPGVHSLDLAATWHDGILQANAAAAGPAGAASLPTLTARRSTTGDWTLSAEVQAAARLPDFLLTALRDNGLDLRGVSPVSTSAKVTYVGGWTVNLTDLALAADQALWRGRELFGEVYAADGVGLRVGAATVVWNPTGPASLVASDLRLHARANVRLPAFTLAEGGALQLQAPQLAAGWDRDSKLSLSVPEIAIALGESTVVLPPLDQAQLTGLQCVLRASMRHDPDSTDVLLTAPIELSISHARYGGESGIRVPPSRLQISTPPSSPLLTRNPDGWTGSADLAWQDARLDASGAAWSARLARVTARARSTVDGTWSVDGDATVDSLSVKHEALGVGLEGLSLQVPVRGILGDSAASKHEEGTFSAEAVVYGNRRFPGITGSVFLSREGLWAGLDWPLLTEGVVKASAAVDWTGVATNTQLQAWVPAFDFTRADEIRAFLPEALADADIRGTFSAQVQYFITPDTVIRWGEVEVKNGSLRSRELDAELIGINGRVWTRSFSPLETPPGQTLTVERGRLGKLEVFNGTVDFRLDPGDIVFVEAAAFGYAGGVLSARGFRVQPGRGAADIVVYADNVDIGTMATTLSEGRISGTGKLYARLPVSVVWPDRIHLGTGYIYAEASGEPGRTGTLRFTGYAQDIGNLVARSMGGPTGDRTRDAAMTQVQSRVTSALVDFGFNSLTLDLTKPDNAPLTLTIRTNGRGPAVPATRGSPGSAGQELNLTFNVTGLDEIINQYLGLRGTGIGF